MISSPPGGLSAHITWVILASFCPGMKSHGRVTSCPTYPVTADGTLTSCESRTDGKKKKDHVAFSLSWYIKQNQKWQPSWVFVTFNICSLLFGYYPSRHHTSLYKHGILHQWRQVTQCTFIKVLLYNFEVLALDLFTSVSSSHPFLTVELLRRGTFYMQNIQATYTFWNLNTFRIFFPLILLL